MIIRYVLLSLVPALCVARAAAAGLEAGTLFWNADDGQNESLLWGPAARWVPGDGDRPIDVRASLIQGMFNQGGDRERQREVLATGGWAGPWGALAAGWTYHDIDTELRRGFVWSYPEEEKERNADIHGPYLAYGMEWPPGRPLRAAFSAGWMPYDAGDLNDLGYDGSFYDLAGGMQWLAVRLRAEAGYRYRAYRDLPDRVIDDLDFDRSVQDGWYVSLLFRF